MDKVEEYIKEQEGIMAEIKEYNERYNRIIEELEQERKDGLKEMTESLKKHNRLTEEIKQETKEGLAEMEEQNNKENTEETPIKKSVIITKVADNHFQVAEVTTIKGDTTIIMQELSKALLKLTE